jgi:hypothetical protein
VSAGAAVLDIYASVDVVIHPQAQAANGYRLPAGQVVQIRSNGEIDVLHLDFQGVGSVVINELPE